MARFASVSRVPLPEEYVAFMRRYNGGEGVIGEEHLRLYRIEELREMNDGYCVEEFVPGLFLIGTDGGLEAVAIDLRSPAKPIVYVPFVGMEESAIVVMAPGFNAFLQRLHRSAAR